MFRSFLIIFRELRNINDPQSAHGLHNMQNTHEYEARQYTMTLLQNANTGVHMNTLEKNYIQLRYHQNRLISEQHDEAHKPMFDPVNDLDMKHATT